MVKLDLACGQNKKEGFLGVDIASAEGVDVVHDLTVTPWPFEDESVEEAHSAHFIEHLTGDQFITFMNELWRVLTPGGRASFIAPYYTSSRSAQDPTHRQPIVEAKFLYFNKGWRTLNKLDHYPITCDFDFTYAYNITDPRWITAEESARLFAIKHYWNVVDDLIIHLTKKA